jgi:SET domain-containing protein
MFLIPTFVAPSAIHGLGCFTNISIKKGAMVWKYWHGFDRIFTKEQVLMLPEPAQQHIFKCGWLDPKTGFYLLGIDYDSFVNHAPIANLIEGYTGTFDVVSPMIASRDIEAGEELTENYNEWDDPEDIKRKLE